MLKFLLILSSFFFFTYIILMFAETARAVTFCQLTASLQRKEKHSG